MFIIESYSLAVIFCFIAMFSWGSWANTQKMAAKSWRFELFYWDYALGIILFSIITGLTLGSWGHEGRSFIEDLQQGDAASIQSAMIGGVLFNVSNILLVAAIALAGMSIAITIAVGIALVLGVLVNYLSFPSGNPLTLFVGVAFIIAATIASAYAYKKIKTGAQKASVKGIIIAITSGLIMSFFYRFIASAMTVDFANPEPGKLTPYSAVFFFSAGLFLSNLILNTIIMKWPFVGVPVSFRAYFKGSLPTHLIGVLGGAIWCMGLSASILASGEAGFAISYGLGQGATIIAVLWGVFIWKEFKNAAPGVNLNLGMMMVFYITGLASIVMSKFI